MSDSTFLSLYGLEINGTTPFSVFATRTPTEDLPSSCILPPVVGDIPNLPPINIVLPELEIHTPLNPIPYFCTPTFDGYVTMNSSNQGLLDIGGTNIAVYPSSTNPCGFDLAGDLTFTPCEPTFTSCIATNVGDTASSISMDFQPDGNCGAYFEANIDICQPTYKGTTDIYVDTTDENGNVSHDFVGSIDLTADSTCGASIQDQEITIPVSGGNVKTNNQQLPSAPACSSEPFDWPFLDKNAEGELFLHGALPAPCFTCETGESAGGDFIFQDIDIAKLTIGSQDINGGIFWNNTCCNNDAANWSDCGKFLVVGTEDDNVTIAGYVGEAQTLIQLQSGASTTTTLITASDFTQEDICDNTDISANDIRVTGGGGNEWVTLVGGEIHVGEASNDTTVTGSSVVIGDADYGAFYVGNATLASDSCTVGTDGGFYVGRASLTDSALYAQDIYASGNSYLSGDVYMYADAYVSGELYVQGLILDDYIKDVINEMTWTVTCNSDGTFDISAS